MRLRFRSFATAKHGNRLADCEDSVSVSEHRGRFAVADGASQSWAARDWARLLTKRWIETPPTVAEGSGPLDDDAVASWLREAQVAFGELDQGGGAAIPAYLRAHRTNREGVAHATLLAAMIDRAPTPAQVSVLRMVGVGDSCGFVIRDQALIASVPAEVHDLVFDSTPSLVMSCGPLPQPLQTAEVAMQPGDRCYLATDALAEVLRDAYVAGQPLWDRLDSLTGPSFLDLVAELRAAGMENDDVAVAVAKVDG